MDLGILIRKQPIGNVRSCTAELVGIIYPVLMMEYQTMSRVTRLSSTIKTWTERCKTHPDHQMGMVTHAMICLRMQEEIDELREALETLERANP